MCPPCQRNESIPFLVQFFIQYPEIIGQIGLRSVLFIDPPILDVGVYTDIIQIYSLSGSKYQLLRICPRNFRRIRPSLRNSEGFFCISYFHCHGSACKIGFRIKFDFDLL